MSYDDKGIIIKNFPVCLTLQRDALQVLLYYNVFSFVAKLCLNTQLLEHNVTVAILSSLECTGHWSCRISSSPQGICFHQQPEGLFNISERPTCFFFQAIGTGMEEVKLTAKTIQLHCLQIKFLKYNV